jgi:aminoglycoside phosphotransferase (APT) family kinase protein
VLSGISTYVYRIQSGGRTWYLRVLPDEEASLASEVVVLALLHQHHLKVPPVVHYQDNHPLLGRSFMIEEEIKGLALSRSQLSEEAFDEVARAAGRELARLNSLPVDGFGWVQVERARPQHLRARWPTFRAFALAYRADDLRYLREHVLNAQVSADLEEVLTRYDAWLDLDQGYLAHGDFDTTHIFQDQGCFTGIIDFGEVRGTGRWYDLAHFRIRDGAFPTYRLFPALERGYAEVVPLPVHYEQHLRFTSIVINIRALTRAFQTRPPDEYIWRQLAVLREDLAALG